MKCDLCHDPDLPIGKDLAEDAELMVEHLRLMHPDAYGEGVERWPDGAIVLHDTTIDPADFTTPED